MSAGVTESNALLSGVSRYEGGQERARLFSANEAVAKQQAQSEAQAGAYNEEMVRMRGAAMEGQQVAQVGASGLQMKGTPTAVIAGTRAINEMDALTTRNNALRRAWGFQVQEASDAEQAKFSQRAGEFGGAGSILSGGAQGFKQEQATGTWF